MNLQGEELAIPEDDDLIGFALQLGLDEAQQMLLVHACGVMHVRVDLRDTTSVSAAAGGFKMEPSPKNTRRE